MISTLSRSDHVHTGRETIRSISSCVWQPIFLECSIEFDRLLEHYDFFEYINTPSYRYTTAGSSNVEIIPPQYTLIFKSADDDWFTVSWGGVRSKPRNSTETTESTTDQTTPNYYGLGRP